MKLIKNLLLNFLIIFAISCSSRVASLYDYEEQSIPEGLTISEVEKAIRIAATKKKWQIKKNKKSENSFIAYQNARGHSAIIEIKYSTTNYSLLYLKSTNLNYNPEKKTIHRNYMKWIKSLKTIIDNQLLFSN